jgi:hypothetical protein
MSTYRHAFGEGANYFFTVVAFSRLPILTKDESRSKLDDAGWMCGQFTALAVSVQDGGGLFAAGAFALHLVIAGAGCGLSGVVEGDQALIHQGISSAGGTGRRAQCGAREEE